MVKNESGTGRPDRLPEDVQESLQREAESGEESAEARLSESARIWALTQSPAPPPGGWQQFQDYLSAPPTARAVTSRRHGRFGHWLKAAMIVLGIGIGAMLPYVRGHFAEQPVTTVTAPVRGHALVELPGGVTVRLNAVSSLSYAADAAAVEEVYLSGEAYFEVEHDPDRLFVVRTQSGVIRDLGTRFNVRAREGRVAVVVTEGAVSLESAGADVRVAAGETSSASAGQRPTAPRAVNVESALAWTEGRLAVRDAPLGSVAKDLERRYGIRFHVEPRLSAERITATLGPDTDAESAALAICAAVAATCERVTDGWRITGR